MSHTYGSPSNESGTSSAMVVCGDSMKSVDQDVGTVANLGSTEGSRSGMNVSSKALDSRGKRACLCTFCIVGMDIPTVARSLAKDYILS